MITNDDRPGGEAEATSTPESKAIPGDPARSHGEPHVPRDEMYAAALQWAAYNWRVFPTWGKVPAIPGAHRSRLVSFGPCVEGLRVIKDPLRGKCRGECGQLGHGVWDASCDPTVIEQMWSGPRARCAVSCRIPDKLLMIDIDPRHGGDRTWARLLAEHGAWPECEQHTSGRGDGGLHLWVRRPPGKLTDARLGAGVEIKHHGGAAVLPPSRHDETRRPYVRVDGPIPAPPSWFVELVTVAPSQPPGRRRAWRGGRGASVADAFCASRSWHEVLEPHGWECLDCDGDEDGARWLHPEATSGCSATVSNGSLYVYSTSTAFEATLPGEPHGYSRFAAYAVLDHGGDMSAAAKALLRHGGAP